MKYGGKDECVREQRVVGGRGGGGRRRRVGKSGRGSIEIESNNYIHELIINSRIRIIIFNLFFYSNLTLNFMMHPIQIYMNNFLLFIILDVIFAFHYNYELFIGSLVQFNLHCLCQYINIFICRSISKDSFIDE